MNQQLIVETNPKAYTVRWSPGFYGRSTRPFTQGTGIAGSRTDCEAVAMDLEDRSERMGFDLRYWAGITA